jgi:hypothetical protein
MLHLLPEKYIHKLRSEYQVRFAILAMRSVGFSIIVFLCALIPSFILLQNHKETSEIQQATKVVPVSNDAKMRVETLEKLIIQGKAIFAKNTQVNAETISDVLALKTPGIIIRNFSVGKEVKERVSPVVINIKGIADTRTTLTGFIQSLQKSYVVGDIPTGTYKYEKDLQFDIVLKQKPK